jgi:hypothetical protein
VTKAKYTKWKGTSIRKAKPSSRSEQLAEEKRVVAETHAQLKVDFLEREAKRNKSSSLVSSTDGNQPDEARDD